MSCVVLAERHHGLAEGVRGLLETMFGTIVMVADKGSLLDVASRLQPDVAVVDLSLGHDGGLDWLRSVRQHCPALKVVALSVHDEPAVRRAAMDAGADDFVLKRAIAFDLLAAIARVRASPDRGSHPGARAMRNDPSIGTCPGSSAALPLDCPVGMAAARARALRRKPLVRRRAARSTRACSPTSERT